MTNQPVLATYPALREEVVQILQEGKERARQAVEREKVQTYWEVGRVLHTHLLAYRERANYREQVLARLAQDVGMSQRLLYQMLELYRAFPILHARAKLGRKSRSWC
ncbi:MAG: hypothetical protein A3F84_08585 [Candidatus Handelsmanbacteria bacterium RIFCSPLOWO2_12_FULL_64_10]|uniref:YhcG N-terminal domain-containing protein n=1 Tax=Handelsmanbacteria sp. (strain RIFCSPLOWO2_12_FULL_64_10) TaxID=1817868 RepID=A0A1F6CJV6_HANXR|nr:MAG: hypothetical protein A3F84_08585 [Candidatus Handelsmanbacteria bacterium RIFCSPLOWO2_12_FULL_64_10]